jgi:hypothetical protein
VAEKITSRAKRVKGKKAKREKTMRQPDFFNLSAFLPFPPHIFRADSG